MEPFVHRSVVLAASRERVWRALTDDEELSAWFDADVRLDAAPGGSVAFRWRDGSVHRGVVDVVEHESRLALRWWQDRRGAALSAVEFTLDEVAGGVRLTVSETVRSAAAGIAPPGTEPLEASTGPVGLAVSGGVDRWPLRLARLRRLGEEALV